MPHCHADPQLLGDHHPAGAGGFVGIGIDGIRQQGPGDQVGGGPTRVRTIVLTSNERFTGRLPAEPVGILRFRRTSTIAAMQPTIQSPTPPAQGMDPSVPVGHPAPELQARQGTELELVRIQVLQKPPREGSSPP